ncbi:MAG: hypothetical protein KA354_06200 [Phycisphaerae bacterium]|nr:hypothetical protein [Phycisphaerae bacterium]
MTEIGRRDFMGRAAFTVGGLAAGRILFAEQRPAPSFVVKVLYDGNPPEPKEVDCSEDPYCAQLVREKPRTEDTLLVSKDRELQNVFVAVVKGLPKDSKWPAPSEPVRVNEKCWFTPHVVGVMVGQPLEFHNDTKTLEVPHGFARRNKEFSFNIPEGQRRRVVLEYPEVIKLKCDVHPWELAWCHVVDHPFFAISDAKGQAAVQGLPTGEYEIELWHEILGTRTVAVKVQDGKTATTAAVKFHPDRRRRPATATSPAETSRDSSTPAPASSSS